MNDVSCRSEPEKTRKGPFLAGVVIALALCLPLVHATVFFWYNPSRAPVVLFFFLWLCFRLALPRLSDPKKIARGFLVGFEMALFLQIMVNAYFLFEINRRFFAGSLYFSAGLFFVLDRLRAMVPFLLKRWPASSPRFWITALFFFGCFSSVLLLQIRDTAFHTNNPPHSWKGAPISTTVTLDHDE